MTDAPKTIWPYHWHRYDTKNGDGKGQVEYTRTDIAQAELAVLQAENAKLREAVDEWASARQEVRNYEDETWVRLSKAESALSAYRNVKGENE